MNILLWVKVGLWSAGTMLKSKKQAKYESKNEIGCGSYGRVYKGTLDNEPIAVKVLHKSLLSGSIIDGFQEECELLQRLNHKNVVKLIQFNISYSSVVTKTRNDPQRPTTIHNDPQRSTTIFKQPRTISKRPKKKISKFHF